MDDQPGTTVQDHSKVIRVENEAWPPRDTTGDSLPEVSAFSRASAHREASLLADSASRLEALATNSERMSRLVQQTLELGELRNDKLAKILETLTRESSELFDQMRDTMELMQGMIGAIDQQMQRLGQVTAALVLHDETFVEMIAAWQAEHQH